MANIVAIVNVEQATNHLEISSEDHGFGINRMKDQIVIWYTT